MGGEALTGAEEGCDGAAVFGDAAAAGFHDEAREAGVERVARHFLKYGARCPQLAQQVFGVFDGGFGRSIQPFNTFEVCRKSLQQQRGGGQVGAVLLNSRYIVPGTDNTTGSYNHYSALRSYEDLLGLRRGGTDGLGHLGFAAEPGLAPFGRDVFNTSPHRRSPHRRSPHRRPGRS